MHIRHDARVMILSWASPEHVRPIYRSAPNVFCQLESYLLTSATIEEYFSKFVLGTHGVMNVKSPLRPKRLPGPVSGQLQMLRERFFRPPAIIPLGQRDIERIRTYIRISYRKRRILPTIRWRLPRVTWPSKPSIVLLRLIVFIISTPFMWVTVISIGSIATYLASTLFLASGQIVSAEAALALSDRGVGHLARVFDTAENILSYAQPVQVPQAIRRYHHLLSTGIEVNTSAIHTVRLIDSFVDQVGEGMLGSEDNSNPDLATVSKLRNELSHLYTLSAIMETEAITAFSGAGRGERLLTLSTFQRGLSLLRSFRRLHPQVDGMLSVYETVFSRSGTSRYLMLFQNSMEVRPTGGFIGSIGLATVYRGKLDQFEIQDVYELDGQLKGHIDPPLPIRHMMRQEHWYLRDSNWEPNFPDSAIQAAWFYEKEAGMSVDGVIAINSTMTEKLLEVTGPVYLRDFRDAITRDNFFTKSLYYTQENFFPGSQQKDRFLTALSGGIRDQLLTIPRQSLPKLLQTVMEMLASRDIIMYSRHPDVQEKIESLGWSGRWSGQSRCPPEADRCVPGFALMSEANLGVNKANFFVTRNVSYSLEFQLDGLVRDALSVQMTNSSEGVGITGGGDYVVHDRIFLPAGAKEVEVRINGTPVQSVTLTPGGQHPPLPFREGVTMSSGMSVIPVAFTVPAGTSVTLDVVATRSYNRFGSSVPIAFYTLKQPGIRPYPFTLRVRTPETWNVSIHSIDGSDVPRDDLSVANDSWLEYNTHLTSELVLTGNISIP